MYNITRMKMELNESLQQLERKSKTMRKNLIKMPSIIMMTLIIFLSFAVFSEALEEDPRQEETSLLVMERVTDFFTGDNFNVLEDLRDRVEELTESIGRGTEKIGESMEKLTDFIGFGTTDSDEEKEESETGNEEERISSGQVVGTFKTKAGEPFENIRVNLGNYATYTDSEGEFNFDNIPYGVYTLSYQESQGGELKNIEEILIDSDNERYVFSLVLDTGNEGAVLGEEENGEEILVDSDSEGAPEDEGIEDPEENSNTLLLLLLLILILLGILVFLLMNRKHIKIIDGGTGETLAKRKVDIKSVTWIDLTEEFHEASQEKIRVRFIRSAIKKLCGKKVVFTVDDQIVAEIPEYTGELDFLVKRKSAALGNMDKGITNEGTGEDEN